MIGKMKNYEGEIYACLRILTGFLILFHGLQKGLGILTDHQPPVGSQVWWGGWLELAGGILVMAGYQTRWAAFFLSGEMAVAYFQFHWKFQFDSNFFPIANHGELAVLLCFVFLYLAARGGGKWSLDEKK